MCFYKKNRLLFNSFSVLLQAHLPLEYGEHKCRTHQRRYASGRKAHQSQPDCHPTDAGAGEQ